jgi:hypothetical protein
VSSSPVERTLHRAVARQDSGASTAWWSFRAAVLAFALLGSLAAADGGYWPTAWGWGALSLLWVAILALVLSKEVRLSRLMLAWLTLICALLAWNLLSTLWTTSVTRTVLEAQRLVLYLAAIVAVLVAVRPSSSRALLGGTLAASTVVSAYCLLTRLLPDRVGIVDPIAGYRLSEPIGYWNGLGLFAAIGSLLAAGFAARANHRSARGAAAASLALLLPTLYFTFSRGAWAALMLGAAVSLAFERRRLQLVAAWMLFMPPALLGVYVSFRSQALTRSDANLGTAADEGLRLGLVLGACALLSAAGAALAPRRLESSPGVRRRLRLAVPVAVAVALVVMIVGVLVQYGSPANLVRVGYRAFTLPLPAASADLNERLFNLSGSRRDLHWRVAWRQYTAHRWLGSGAGTYEQHWLRDRPLPMKVRDAHSLYLETLAELGPVGLALLLIVLAIPLWAGVRTSGHPLTGSASGAYAAFLLHAGADWDWELPAVALSGLLVGAAMVLVASPSASTPLAATLRFGFAAAAAALAAVAVAGLCGSRALATSAAAADTGRWVASEEAARKAMRWAPWSSEPWRRAGEARLAGGDLAGARESFAVGIEKEPLDWELWFSLALSTTGPEQRRAAAKSVLLNPLSPEIAESRAVLGLR